MARETSGRERENYGRETAELTVAISTVIVRIFFYVPQSCGMGTTEGRRAEEFFAAKNPTASAGFEPANLGTRGQRANHWTIETA
jgi:hypothetical protein